MSLSSAASAAPAPVTIAGRSLLVHPLSDRDFDELSLWHQGRILRIARASLDPTSTPAEREETLKAAYAYASGIDFFTESRSEGFLAQKDVLIQFVWRLLRKNDGITLDDVLRIVKSGENLVAVMDAWDLVQFGCRAETDDKGAEKKRDPVP